MHKIAKNNNEAWILQDTQHDKPHCWIQWKGTDVCMDFHCKCGFFGHVDATFAYNLVCPECGAIYMCNGHIELIEIEEKPEYYITPE